MPSRTPASHASQPKNKRQRITFVLYVIYCEKNKRINKTTIFSSWSLLSRNWSHRNLSPLRWVIYRCDRYKCDMSSNFVCGWAYVYYVLCYFSQILILALFVLSSTNIVSAKAVFVCRIPPNDDCRLLLLLLRVCMLTPHCNSSRATSILTSTTDNVRTVLPQPCEHTLNMTGHKFIELQSIFHWTFWMVIQFVFSSVFVVLCFCCSKENNRPTLE